MYLFDRKVQNIMDMIKEGLTSICVLTINEHGY